MAQPPGNSVATAVVTVTSVAAGAPRHLKLWKRRTSPSDEKRVTREWGAPYCFIFSLCPPATWPWRQVQSQSVWSRAEWLEPQFSHWRTKKGDLGEWESKMEITEMEEQLHQVVYKLLSPLFRSTRMDLVLSSIPKALRTGLGDESLSRSQAGHWMGQIWIALQKLWHWTDIKTITHRSLVQVMHPEPIWVSYLLQQNCQQSPKNLNNSQILPT